MKHLRTNRSILNVGLIVTAVFTLLIIVVTNVSASTGCFPDTNGHWAETFICWLKDNGIVAGYGDGTYRPNNATTRAEMAVYIQNVHGLDRWGQDWSGSNTGLTLTNADGGAFPQFRLQTSDAGEQYDVWAGNGGFSIDDPNAGTEPFFIPYGAPSGTLVSDTSGRVGIGTWSPDAGLEIVREDTQGYELRLTETSTSSSEHSKMYFDVGGTGQDYVIGVNAGTDILFVNRAGGGDNMWWYPDGTVGVLNLASSTTTHLCRNGWKISSCSSAAEYLPTTDMGQDYPEAGELVSLVPNTDNPYEDDHATFVASKSEVPCDPNLLGFLLDPELGADGNKANDYYMPLAIYGYFPVKVTMEGGAIQRGDGITSSSTPGNGMKATQACRIVGYALEAAEEDGTILVFAHLTDYIPPNMLSQINDLLSGE